MTIPGYDEEIMSGRKFTYHKVVEQKYYSLNLTSISKGNEKIDIPTGFKAVIDSGTSVIVGPKSFIDPLLKNIEVKKDCSNKD